MKIKSSKEILGALKLPPQHVRPLKMVRKIVLDTDKIESCVCGWKVLGVEICNPVLYGEKPIMVVTCPKCGRHMKGSDWTSIIHHWNEGVML